ncbi:3-hydroxyacyl-CoA dehydrogenase NAD-binding domain-containing protein [Sphingobacterium sp. UT-1RO-CII-1]|uniref:3-hydroxyacyl-CoA dehydrogenase NAD-binding domain-containing protein n=1 Tax=Sphingobacterium sp. UT-1RO-CII-1 TaxID=2995225 RepID=UPI00227A22C3|nr:3-hydroxyacyl-CoA dehydrogenase NAD-binding domain-containing protein [Sphingobacterium sp. UT-1RO-CII-1]MCY4780315.1 3-hydroxyacyl-CoA dehydrogenase NAD-binding domain-containing protein [Sphingobacterium sp. UT-1RO-CII-1]
MRNFDEKAPFQTHIHENGIAVVEPNDDDRETSIGFIQHASSFVDHINTLLAQEQVKAVMYYSLFPHIRMRFKRLFEEEKRHDNYEEQLHTLLRKINELQKQNKPLISVIRYVCSGIDLSVHLWAHYRIIEERVSVRFPESQLGLFPNLGAIGNTLSSMPLADAYSFLTQSNYLTASEAVAKGLFDIVMDNYTDPMPIAEQFVRSYEPHVKTPTFSNEDLALFESLAASTRKRTRGLIAGTNASLEIMEAVLKNTKDDLSSKEAQCYSRVVGDKKTEAMVRTGYYHMIDIRRLGTFPIFEPKRIGIIGAGMMGAGIAYEAARAGMKVLLKDTTLEHAERGKTYAERAAEKLEQQGLIEKGTVNKILAHITPVADYDKFQDLDVIIEAVFEDLNLKKSVLQEVNTALNEDGILATNTTSLLISELAKASKHKKDFVGMHFFSPVERMKLVEIVRGKHSSNATIEKAMHVANKLQKTVIVVNDGPAFYTSRVFFNYLLEAITMLLEGIPAAVIEDEAKKAGFGLGPLAVLDEISLPLMLHVYDQLPTLHSSQQRAYQYLSTLIAAGRSGRKTKQGFYNYEEPKEIWQDPSLPLLPISDLAVERGNISKRLLHIMALDSYRCLDEGILEDPSDGDIGSTLGIGYPKHTGGVFSHMEQVGLSLFVQECEQFADKGQQWEIPDSLRKLAENNFTFYKGTKSNWK